MNSSVEKEGRRTCLTLSSTQGRGRTVWNLGKESGTAAEKQSAESRASRTTFTFATRGCATEEEKMCGLPYSCEGEVKGILDTWCHSRQGKGD